MGTLPRLLISGVLLTAFGSLLPFASLPLSSPRFCNNTVRIKRKKPGSFQQRVMKNDKTPVSGQEEIRIEAALPSSAHGSLGYFLISSKALITPLTHFFRCSNPAFLMG